jgi:hypothetical protein
VDVLKMSSHLRCSTAERGLRHSTWLHLYRIGAILSATGGGQGGSAGLCIVEVCKVRHAALITSFR